MKKEGVQAHYSRNCGAFQSYFLFAEKGILYREFADGLSGASAPLFLC